MNLEHAVVRTCADEKIGINKGEAMPYILSLSAKLSACGFLFRGAPWLDNKIHVYRRGAIARVMHTSTFISPTPDRDITKHSNFYVVTGSEAEVNDLMAMLRRHRREFDYKSNLCLKDILDSI